MASLVLLATLSPACGKKGPPIPPEPSGPSAPLEVQVRQIGDRTVTYVTVPEPRGTKPSQVTTEAILVRVAYEAGLAAAADANAFTRRGEVVGSFVEGLESPGTRVPLDDRSVSELANSGVGWTLLYGARIRDARGRLSPLATAPSLELVAPGTPPLNLSAEPTADGVRLSWQPPEVQPEPVAAAPVTETSTETPTEGTTDTKAVEGATGKEKPATADEETTEPQGLRYNVYRYLPEGRPGERPINAVPVVGTEYLDGDAETGESYVYIVRTLISDATPIREGPPSEPLAVSAEDLFAPQPPVGLIAVQEGPAVRLFWNPSGERDLAGYRVYRRSDQSEWSRIGPDPVEQPTYLDKDVGVDQLLSYRVTAIDRASPPNESPPSEVTEHSVRVEPPTPRENDDER